MAIIKSVRGYTPKIGSRCFLAETAIVIGDVEMDSDSSVWFNAVVRGDVNSIRIGRKVNIQDGTIIHCTYEKTKTIIGDNVSIGHNAIVHGCTVESNVLVGMGSIIMDHAVVESNSIVAAGALVTEGTTVTSGSIFAGIPAVKIKDISTEQFEILIKNIAKNYIEYTKWYTE